MRKTAAMVAALVIALVGVVAVPGATTAVDIGAWQLNPATGHYYRQVDNLTWVQAESYAVSVGGHLVTINDQAEQDWLSAIFTDPNLWIGMNDRAVEGSMVWSSGEQVTYTNWTVGEPNNCTFCGPPDGHGDLPQGEDAAVMNWTDPWGSIGWNDLADFGTLGAIVEVTSLPRGQVGGTVSGTAGYWVFDDPTPALARQVSVSAKGKDPVSGRWSLTYVGDKTTVAGDVTCLVVDGDQAWVAGRITSVKKNAGHQLTIGEGAFLWVRDGATAGVPDKAYAWIADPVLGQPGASVAQMEAWCLSKTGNMVDFGFPDGFTVDRGDITVQPAP